MDTLEFRTIKFIAVVGWIQAPVVCAIELIASNFPISLRYAPGHAFELRAFKPVALSIGGFFIWLLIIIKTSVVLTME